jgi:hypothetical protein
VPVASVDDLLKSALTKELVAIEWTEEDEKAGKPREAQGRRGRDPDALRRRWDRAAPAAHFQAMT